MTKMMRTVLSASLVLAASVAGCGGGKSTEAKGPGGAGASGVADLDVTDAGMSDLSDATPELDAEPPPPPPPVVFKLMNTAEEELVFSMDKGWQPVIFAYSGKPPKAKPILMFPKHCTASCNAAEEGLEVCPYCPEPEKVKDIKAAEKREVVAAGASLEVPWDGLIHVYKKTRGDRNGRSVRCECFEKQPVPAETYTVRACGFRVTQSAATSSKYQCADGSMVFPPPAEGSQVVELTFPKAK